MSEVAERAQRLNEARELEESADRMEESVKGLLEMNMTEAMSNAAKGMPGTSLGKQSYELGVALDARNREFAETLMAHVRQTREAVAGYAGRWRRRRRPKTSRCSPTSPHTQACRLRFAAGPTLAARARTESGGGAATAYA